MRNDKSIKTHCSWDGKKRTCNYSDFFKKFVGNGLKSIRKRYIFQTKK